MRNAEADRLVGYMPLVVRMGGLADDDRKFCASVIARNKRGAFTPTDKQMWRMARLVERFQRERMAE